jgi:hypothetical protein
MIAGIAVGAQFLLRRGEKHLLPYEEFMELTHQPPAKPGLWEKNWGPVLNREEDTFGPQPWCDPLNPTYSRQDTPTMRTNTASSPPNNPGDIDTNNDMTRNNNKPNNLPATSKTSVAPVANNYGYTIKMAKPSVRRSSTGAVITGSDFAGTVRALNTTAYEPAASIPLNPAYFQAAEMGVLSKTFEKYRFRRAIVEYIPQVSTSTAGQMILTSSRSIKEPFIAGTDSNFLARALSKDNAIAGPLWERNVCEISCLSDFKLVDPLADGDLDDSISEEIQVYVTASAAATVGILILHYEIEFMNPLYSIHSTLIPISAGVGSYATLADDSAVNATTDAVILGGAVGVSFSGVGSIWRLVFRQGASTLPTGPASWAAAAAVQNRSADTTTTLTATSTNLTCVTGTTFYGVFNNSKLVLYNSYDTACAGGLNGVITYQTATTAAGVWAFIVTLVRAATDALVTSQ